MSLPPSLPYTPARTIALDLPAWGRKLHAVVGYCVLPCERPHKGCIAIETLRVNGMDIPLGDLQDHEVRYLEDALTEAVKGTYDDAWT
jgi:hypothetical protein